MGTSRNTIGNYPDDLNLGLLRRLLSAAEKLSPTRFKRPSEETIWAYLLGTATRAQRREMYTALASSTLFRNELLDLADAMEESPVCSAQASSQRVDVLVIQQECISGPGNIVLVTLKGLLPKSHADVLGGELDRIIAEGHTRIVVDLSQVIYICSAGWLAFSGRVIQLRKHDGDLKLAGLRQHVRSIFELTQLDRFLDAHPTIDEAIASLRPTE